MLENVRTAINNLLTGGAVQAYTINTGSGSRSLQHFSLQQLLDLETRLVARQAGTNGGRLLATFADPS